MVPMLSTELGSHLATYAEHLWGSTKVSSWEYPNE